MTTKTKLKLKCKKCGVIKINNYYSMKRKGYRCLTCSKKEKIQDYIYQAEDEGYKLLTTDISAMDQNKQNY